MDKIIGKVKPPPGVSAWGADIAGLSNFLNAIFKFVIVVAGLYAFVNLLLAGYAFMSAGDDPKKMAGAWSKIWQSLIGVAVTAGAFVLAAIFGRLLYGPGAESWTMLLQLQVFGPSDIK